MTTNETIKHTLPVLENGYVELVELMGSDLSVANAARASFAKRSHSFSEADAKLVRFLAREQHSSPFRHAMLTFEIKAPLMVARQWWKYVVGSDHTMDGWNEASRRYITMEPEFYIPDADQWRLAPENKKQGSGGPVEDGKGFELTHRLMMRISQSLQDYEDAMTAGVAPEQARLFLHAYAMHTNWWWTCSLQSAMHFVNQRLAEDAQSEIQEYAKAIRDLMLPHFPVSMELLVDRETN